MKARYLWAAAAALFWVTVSRVEGQQPANPTQVQIQQSGTNPLYKITINVVERTTKAINYRNRSGATKVDFRGTALLPEARGEAKVESKQGYIEVEVEFDNLQAATRFGSEYLTYVMWAITPEGRAKNLGEVILNGSKSKLDVTTELQTFGLIVTAEPYFAVSQPSDVVVMENFVRQDTAGKIEEIAAKFELLQRGQYTVNVPASDLKPIPLDKDTPLDLYEAQNALRIARWAGADKDAADSFQKAARSLEQAEAYKARKAGSKPIATAAREAVQTAEDARLIALKRQDEQRIARERQAAAEPVPRRRWALAALAGANTVWFWLLYYPLAADPESLLHTQVVHHSIDYSYPDLAVYQYVPRPLLRLLYVLAVATPLLIASSSWGRLPGLGLAASAALAALAFGYAFVSVWCFFAAVLAVYLCAVFRSLPAREAAAATARPPP